MCKLIVWSFFSYFILFVPAKVFANTKGTVSIQCPDIKALQKKNIKEGDYNFNNTVWFAGNAFLSHSASLARSVHRFLGAHWQGNHVGHVFCLYEPIPKNLFIIKLAYQGLVNEPTDNHWKSVIGVDGKVSTNVKDCVSDKQSHCVFQTQKKEKMIDIYTVLKKIK